MTPMQEESMRMIITSGDLLLAVVNDVLDYSKLEIDNVEIDVKLSDMQDILSCIIQSIEMKSQSTQSIKPYSDVRLPQYVHIDSRRVQQILFNLLGNAIKFSKKASVVELTVELVRCPCPLGTGDDHRSTCSSGGHDQSNDEAFSPATGSPTLTANMTILLKDTAARLHVAHFTRLPLATKICLIYRKRLRELETDT